MQSCVCLTPGPMLRTGHTRSRFPFPLPTLGEPQVYLNILAAVLVFSQGSTFAFVKSLCSSLCFLPNVGVWVLRETQPQGLPPHPAFCFAP